MSGKLNGKGVATPPVDAEEKFDAARRVVRQLLAEARAKDQELETLRAQLRLAHDEKLLSLEREMARYCKQLGYLRGCNALFESRIKQLSTQRRELWFELDAIKQLRWFRLGRWLGFYR